MFSYGSFGPLGQQFTDAYDGIWREFKRLWDEHRTTGRGVPEFEAAIRAAATPSGFWLDAMIALGHHFNAMTVASLLDFWPLYQRCFQPSLAAGQTISADTGRIMLAGELNRCRITAAKTPQFEAPRLMLNAVSYGPFTEEQLVHINAYHPKLLEGACGSGYLIQVLRNRPRPVDAIGFDLNVYQAGTASGVTVGITEALPWTEELASQDLLQRGGIELIPVLCPGRTLLISYPEPGGEFAVDALRAFREAGGRRFLFKVGGFIGRHTDLTGTYTPPENPGRNIRDFFEELAKYWGPARQVPAWVPGLYENNLLDFELLSGPRFFSWEVQAGTQPARKTPKERAAERKKLRRRGK